MNKKTNKNNELKRRKPKQDRSKQLVSDILEATAQVLAEHGYENASTNKIAQRAGVSIGSLYQYFPDKESLVAALFKDRWKKLDRLVMQTLMEIMGLPFAEASEKIIRECVDFFSQERELMRVFLKRVSLFSKKNEFYIEEEKLVQISKAYLLRFENELNISDVDTAAFLCAEVGRSMILRTALVKPPYLTEEQLIKGTVEMLCAYLNAK